MRKLLFIVFLTVVMLSSGCGIEMQDSSEANNTETTQWIDVAAYQAPFEVRTADAMKANGAVRATVKRVVDGDTLLVIWKGKEYRVRMLDVDTPESVKQGVAAQPYSKEAFNFTKNKVEGKEVTLYFEKDLKDKYDRVLAHVVLDDGSWLNAMLVGEGFARVQVISPNTKYKKEFYQWLEEAADKGKGLWSLPEGKRPFVKNSKGEYVATYTQKSILYMSYKYLYGTYMNRISVEPYIQVV